MGRPDRPKRGGSCWSPPEASIRATEQVDLRVEQAIVLKLREPLSIREAENHTLEVRLPESWKLPERPQPRFRVRADPRRFSEVIHVSQAGYQTGAPKIGRAGYYLGTLGELDLGSEVEFYLSEVGSGEIVFRGNARLAKDRGFNYDSPQYQSVLVLDFSAFDVPGQYRAGIEGIGESFPFHISDGFFACLARRIRSGSTINGAALPSYALLEVRTCSLPSAKGDRASSANQKTWRLVEKIGGKDHDEQSAPSLKSVDSALFRSSDRERSAFMEATTTQGTTASTRSTRLC